MRYFRRKGTDPGADSDTGDTGDSVQGGPEEGHAASESRAVSAESPREYHGDTRPRAVH